MVRWDDARSEYVVDNRSRTREDTKGEATVYVWRFTAWVLSLYFQRLQFVFHQDMAERIKVMLQTTSSLTTMQTFH